MPDCPVTRPISASILRGLFSLIFGLVLSIQPLFVRAAVRSDLILETVDTSSPRATLKGFMTVMTERYEMTLGPQSLFQTYLRSDRLFPEKVDIKETVDMLQRDRAMSLKFLDLTDIPVAISEQSGWRLTLQLMEIFHHLSLIHISEPTRPY